MRSPLNSRFRGEAEFSFKFFIRAEMQKRVPGADVIQMGFLEERLAAATPPS